MSKKNDCNFCSPAKETKPLDKVVQSYSSDFRYCQISFNQEDGINTLAFCGTYDQFPNDFEIDPYADFEINYCPICGKKLGELFEDE